MSEHRGNTLLKIIIGVGLLILLLVVIGWISFSVNDDSGGITVEGEKIQEDAGDIMEGTRGIVNDVMDDNK